VPLFLTVPLDLLNPSTDIIILLVPSIYGRAGLVYISPYDKLSVDFHPIALTLVIEHVANMPNNNAIDRTFIFFIDFTPFLIFSF